MYPVEGRRKSCETPTMLDYIDPEDGGNKLLQNGGICLLIGTTS
jgi:hypothetical protein